MSDASDDAERGNIGLPSGGGVDDDVMMAMVVVVTGMLRRSPRPRRRALVVGGAAARTAAKREYFASSMLTVLSTSTVGELGWDVLCRLTGEGPLTTRRGASGCFGVFGRDRLPITDE